MWWTDVKVLKSNQDLAHKQSVDLGVEIHVSLALLFHNCWGVSSLYVKIKYNKIIVEIISCVIKIIIQMTLTLYDIHFWYIWFHTSSTKILS